MTSKITHYTVKVEALPQVLEAIQIFLAAIREHEPATRYEAFQYRSEPSRFVHIMTFPDTEAENAHQQAAYTQSFVETLYPNCDILPRFEDITKVS